jgi:multidrug efflux pump
LTVQDIVATIQQNNVDIPSGRIESRQREFLVQTQGQFSAAEPINDLIVADRDGGPVRIRDVATAEDGVENDRQTARFRRQTAVGLGVVKQSDANTVALARAVRQRMADLAKRFPPGLTYSIASDSSRYVEESINSLLATILLATGLVVLVVLAFLRNLWGTAITALAIPASLLGGVTLMYVLGFSVNNLTMLGLILAIGIVIDDAVVVLESCYRHLEQGTDPLDAAREGTREVAFPSIANTLSLSAVFIPVAFTAGLIGRFFFEFGLTVAATVAVSTVTALTLTPMLNSRLLRTAPRRGMVFCALGRAIDSLERVYGWILARAFHHRATTVLVSLAAVGLGALLFTRLSTQFAPSVDREEFVISFETPEGATLSPTDAYVRQVEAQLSDHPDVKDFFMAIGLSRGGGPGKVNEGMIFVHLTPREHRTKHQSEIVQELRQNLGAIPGGRVYLIETSGTTVQLGAELQLVLQHPDIDALASRQDEIMAWMRGQDELTGVRSDLNLNKPQVQVTINRDKAQQMDVSVAQISRTLQLLLGEPDISEIERRSERYEVIPEVVGQGQMIPESLERLYVRSGSGALVSLGNLVTIEETIGPSEIHHFNRIRAATISASTPPGVPLGDVLVQLESYLAESLPAEFQYEYAGRTQDFRESFYYLSMTITFSVVFIYLVLSAQFESFAQPWIILLTLPLAAVGAFAALFALDMPFGIFAFLGLIMLAGMATKNAILMVDYTNVLISEGTGAAEAAQQAARVRFRPVVMTTISTVLGLLPIALGFGAGGEARAPLGVAVAAGLSATTLLTLVVIPVVYTIFVRGAKSASHQHE